MRASVVGNCEVACNHLERAVSNGEMNGNSKGCDGATGTLTSPLFTVDAARPYLNFLMAGGNGDGSVGLKVLDASGAAVASHRGCKSSTTRLQAVGSSASTTLTWAVCAVRLPWRRQAISSLRNSPFGCADRVVDRLVGRVQFGVLGPQAAK